MARQDHDNPPRPEGQAGVPGAPGFAPGMSPQGSRSGPSPGPSDQLKRVSPKLNPSGLPNGGSPMPDGNLSRQGGSPAAMNYTGQMTPDMMQQIKMGDGMGVAGANGMRPPSSHPQHPQFGGAPYTPQQMEQMRAARGAGPLPNGNWPQTTQGQPGMMQQPAQAPQPSQVGTPQQRAMPPPAAVPAGTATNGRPASPPSTANPPSTPSQSTKANPKAKKDGKEARKVNIVTDSGLPHISKLTAKQRPTKKTSNAGAPASTPATDADNPPATPITPMAQASFSQPKNDAQNQATLMQNVASASNTASVAQSQPDANPIPQFPNLEGNEVRIVAYSRKGIESLTNASCRMIIISEHSVPTWPEMFWRILTSIRSFKVLRMASSSIRSILVVMASRQVQEMPDINAERHHRIITTTEGSLSLPQHHWHSFLLPYDTSDWCSSLYILTSLRGGKSPVFS